MNVRGEATGGDRVTSNKEEPGGAMAPPGSRPLYSAKLTPQPLPGGRNRYLGRLLTSLTPPVRIKVGRGVVGDLVPTTPVGVDGVDLAVTVGSVVARIGYLLAVRGVVGGRVARRVVGKLDPTSSA